MTGQSRENSLVVPHESPRDSGHRKGQAKDSLLRLAITTQKGLEGRVLIPVRLSVERVVHMVDITRIAIRGAQIVDYPPAFTLVPKTAAVGRDIAEINTPTRARALRVL